MRGQTPRGAWIWHNVFRRDRRNGAVSVRRLIFCLLYTSGHDQRDWEFATKFGLPIVEVGAGGDVTKEAFVAKDDSAVMVNSGFLNGMTVKEAIPAMKKYVVEQGFGKETVSYTHLDVYKRQSRTRLRWGLFPMTGESRSWSGESDIIS